jgi:hypothetical protein
MGSSGSQRGSHSRKEREMATKNGIDLASVFEGLAIEPTNEPLPASTRGSAAGPNPFGAPLKASVEHSSPYSIYVPPAAVTRAVFLINAAARKENLGVRIVVNVQRDDKGALVKDTAGKAVPIVERSGANKGKVLVRFQGKAERKHQNKPRTHSMVKDKDNAGQYVLRHRASGNVMLRGTKEQVKAEYDKVKGTNVGAPQPATVAATD